MKYIPLLLFLLTLGFATSCKTYSEEEKTNFEQQAIDYAKKNNWNYEVIDGGLVIEILKKGQGKEAIQVGSEVSLSYKGTLLNGVKFDQATSSKPFVSRLSGLIGGFQIGLLGQVAGTKMRMVIPPHLGYGDDALDRIPANSVLVFELSIEDVR